jgi:hypothetical protein
VNFSEVRESPYSPDYFANHFEVSATTSS